MPQANFSLPEGLPKKIDSAKSFLVVLPKNLNVDTVASGLALFLSLQKKNKQVKIGAPVEMTVEYNRLFGVDKISSNIGSRNLIISFPEETVEKISSQTQDGRLNLFIQPKNGAEPINHKNLQYSYSGVNAQAIFIVGAQKLEDLGSLYESEKQIFDKAETINVDVNPANTKFAKNNLIFPKEIALSQIIARVIKKLNLPIDQDIATNLIAGIEQATNNLQTRTNAAIFETLAWAIRQGGKQGHLKSAGIQPTTPPPFTQPAQVPTIPSPFQKPQPIPASTATPPFISQPQTQVAQAQPVPPPFIQQPSTAQPSSNGNSEEKEKKASAPAPDWFKPKIFSGGMRKG